MNIKQYNDCRFIVRSVTQFSETVLSVKQTLKSNVNNYLITYLLCTQKQYVAYTLRFYQYFIQQCLIC